MLTVEDWAEVRRLRHNKGMPIKVIARAMWCSKTTVKAALRSDGPPRYARLPRGSVVDEVEPRIRELLGVADDAGHRRRGADRVGVLDPHLARSG